ncbi:MAG: glycoside hydrolase, partial [Gammaproteobacteria bacterium]|nr:glycoside hydrolase [Gammaproteobacteria bacterium]
PLENPAANGALAPYLASATDGRVVMSWLEPDGEGHALRYAEFGVEGWAEPRTVASGTNWFVNWADFPSVVPLEGELWAAHWLARRPAGGYAYDVYLSTSGDGGASWSDGEIAHTDGTDTEHGFVSLYPDGGGVGFVYLDGRKMANEYTDDPNDTGMTLRSASYLPGMALADEQMVDSLTCDCCQTDVALSSEGPVAVYRNRSEAQIRDIYVTRRVEGRWTEGVPLNDDHWEIPGCPVNGPEIHARGLDVVVAWFTAANDQPRVRFARSTDGGRSFSKPLDLAAGELLGHVGMTVDASGTAWVVWQQKAGEGHAALVMRTVGADDTLGAARVFDEAVEVAAFSVPQVATQAGRLLVAWTAGEYGKTRIGTATIPLAD